MTSGSWRLCDSVAGAKARLYRLIEIAKANGIEPYAYLRIEIAELPNATSVEEMKALLPAPNDDEKYLPLMKRIS